MALTFDESPDVTLTQKTHSCLLSFSVYSPLRLSPNENSV